MKPSISVNTKLRAARNKLEALQRSISRFSNGEPYEIRAHHYVHRTDPSLYLVSFRHYRKKRLPSKRWTILIDELTYHLRSALDQTIFELSVGLNRPDPDGTGFPIVLDKRYLDRSMIQHLSTDQKAFVKSVQPHKRPDDPLWLLAKLNNRNKHRELRFTGVIVALDQQSLAQNLRITVTDLKLSKATLRAAIRPQDGAEFASLTYRRIGPKPHVKMEMNLQIDIELNGRMITGDHPEGGLMRQMVSRVEEIISVLYATP